MEKLLVLGQVPGTDIQISFSMWLNFIAITAGIATFIWFTFSWARRQNFISEVSADDTPLRDTPLHASRLHR